MKIGEQLMDENLKLLSKLEIGKKAIVKSLLAKGRKRRRLLDLGFVKGTIIEAVQKSPGGDPTAYFIRGTLIAIRSEDANLICIS